MFIQRNYYCQFAIAVGSPAITFVCRLCHQAIYWVANCNCVLGVYMSSCRAVAKRLKKGGVFYRFCRQHFGRLLFFPQIKLLASAWGGGGRKIIITYRSFCVLKNTLPDIQNFFGHAKNFTTYHNLLTFLVIS